MHKECPICGRPFSVLDLVLLDTGTGFQCRHCWSRVRATGPVSSPAGRQRPQVVRAAHSGRARRKK
jgi:DNA-directed RNA polymerase subunit RPC12/RpoP